MTRSTIDDGDLFGLEARLRLAETTSEPLPTARVLRRVQSHVATSSATRRRRAARLAWFAIVLVPATAAAAVAAGVLLQDRRAPQVQPRPAVSSRAQDDLLVISQRNSGMGGNVTLGVAPDTVLLVRRDGIVVARATFKPADRPLISNAATILPPQVHAAAGAAYFVDGDGVVRRLTAGGAVSVVASFRSDQPQHMVSFAVSPDGSKLMASVFGFPARPSGGQAGTPPKEAGFSDLVVTNAGGPSRLVKHSALASAPGQLMVLGWDAKGPVVGTSVPLATQGVMPSGWDSPLARLDVQGNLGGALAGGCTASGESDGQRFLCAGTSDQGGAGATVRSETGQVLWSLPGETSSWHSAALAPSADVVALHPAGGSSTTNRLYFQDGHVSAIPDDFYALAWADETHLLGLSGDVSSPRLAQVTLLPGPVVSAPQVLPVNGFFVGTVRS